jgi:WD40 repeat protein
LQVYSATCDSPLPILPTSRSSSFFPFFLSLALAPDLTNTMTEASVATDSDSIAHSNYVPSTMDRAMQAIDINKCETDHFFKNIIHKSGTIILTLSFAAGHLILSTSSLTGQYWTGSVWYYKPPLKAFPSSASSQLLKSSVTGLDGDNGTGDVMFLNDTGTDSVDVLVALDNGSVDHLSLNFSKEEVGPSFFYLDRVATISEQDDVVSGLAKSPDGNTVVAASYDGSVIALDTATLGLTQTYARAHDNLILAVATATKDSNLFVTCGQDGLVASWDLRDKACQGGEFNYILQ